jgi:hypothetical protein
MTSILVRAWGGAALLALAFWPTATSAQYYAQIVVFAVPAPPYQYYGPPPAYPYYAPRAAYPYYAPPAAYPGPYIVYYPGNPVRRFWTRQGRYNHY